MHYTDTWSPRKKKKFFAKLAHDKWKKTPLKKKAEHALKMANVRWGKKTK